MGLTVRYSQNDRASDAILHSIDENVLVEKVTKLIVRDREAPVVPAGTKNPAYEFTSTQYIKWDRNAEGGYIFTKHDKKVPHTFRFESATLR